MKTLLILVLFFSFQSFSQSEFSRFYFDSLHSYSRGFGLTADNGAVLLSKSNIQQSNVTRVDSLGNVVWSKTIEILNKPCDLSEVIETKDNNFVICGAVLSYSDGGAFLIKLNQNGDTLWSRRYTDNFSLQEYSNIIETADSSYILFWRDFGNGGLSVVKIDKIGNLIWTKSFNNNLKKPYMLACAELNDGSLVFSGLTSWGSIINNTNSVILKMNPNGQIAWYKQYGISNWFESIFAVGNEFRIVSRSNQSPNDNIIYAKFDSLGNNYASYVDTITNTSFGFSSFQFNSRQKVNDTTFHTTLYHDYTFLPFTITENATIINNPLPNFELRAGSLISNEGQFYQFGHIGTSNEYQLRFSKVNPNSTLCSNGSATYAILPRPTFGHTNLSFHDTSYIQIISSDIQIKEHTMSSYLSCQSLLSIEKTEQIEFLLYPNPAIGYFTIQTNYTGEFLLELIDLQGRTLSSRLTKDGQQNHCEHLSSGSYLFRLTSTEGKILKVGKINL